MTDNNTETEREKAIQFWTQYDIPFEWDVAIKGRLSGLSRGSAGNGRARDTVNHLFVQESFQDGRLSRDADTYLCDPDAAPKFQFTEERYQDDQGEFIPRVTCETCQERMKRWRTGNGGRVRCHNYDDQGVMCGDGATDLIRPFGASGGVPGWQGRQLAGSVIPVCKDCGEDLVEGAEIDYEFLTRSIEPREIAERTNLPDAWARYDDYHGSLLTDQDGDRNE